MDTSTARAARDKLPVIQRIGYGSGAFVDMCGHWLYPGLAYQVFNIYLGVSPAWIARALLCKLVFEGLCDTLLGWLSDNTRTRFGRRRPYILVGAVISGLLLPMLFRVNAGETDTYYFIYMVCSLAIFVPAISSFAVAHQSLGAELTPDYNERTTIGAFAAAFARIPEVVIFAAPAFATAAVWTEAAPANILSCLNTLLRQASAWIGAVCSAVAALDANQLGALAHNLFGWTHPSLTGKPNILLGCQVYTLLVGAAMAASGVLVFATCRERYYDGVVVGRQQARVMLKESLWTTLKCPAFRVSLAMALAYGIGTSMLGTMGYYTTVYHVCSGNIASAGVWNFWIGLCAMGFGLGSAVFYAWFAKRFGKIAALYLVHISGIPIFASTWILYNRDAPWLQILAYGLITFTCVGFWMLSSSINADVIDLDELQMSKRREGAFAACRGWIIKVGIGVGAYAAGEILASCGFDAKSNAPQPQQALLAIRVCLAAVPVLGICASLLFLFRFPLTEARMAVIRAELEQRRGCV